MSDQESIKEKFARLRPVMDERMCRLWAANEARALGFGGETAVSAATGLSRACIHAAVKELEQVDTNPAAPRLDQRPKRLPRVVTSPYRIRRPGGGRKRVEVK